MNCRHCGSALNMELIDLGTAPPSNAYLTESQLHEPEKWYPLRALVCEKCWLAQTEDFADADELFSPDYAYFSSYSSTWLKHAEDYVDMAVQRFRLGPGSLVVELAANDGYLLQYVKARHVPCLGIEPTKSTANAAREKGLEIVEAFFGIDLAEQLVEQGRQADLIVANNVLAHVSDINDFTSGCSRLLKKNGVATFEFQYLLTLVEQNQFDTIYHEHFSYLSLTAVVNLLMSHGLMVFDVEQLPTHGGSLRIFAKHADNKSLEVAQSVNGLLALEEQKGIRSGKFYEEFQSRAIKVKNDFVYFLLESGRKGLRVGAYGAAAKGNTLLNYAGVRDDLLPYVVDANPAKQGKYLPGSRIPVVSDRRLRKDRPELIVILPWNLQREIVDQLSYCRAWKAKFIVSIPQLKVF